MNGASLMRTRSTQQAEMRFRNKGSRHVRDDGMARKLLTQPETRLMLTRSAGVDAKRRLLKVFLDFREEPLQSPKISNNTYL